MRPVVLLTVTAACLAAFSLCRDASAAEQSLAQDSRAQPPLPRCIEGWRIELVAAAPAINHPSVVCCAPDGRVFVAEDPMDIRTAEASEPKGRIVCLHPDGRFTVYAEGLHAVFGMQYLDGSLYVLHNPRFSRYRDEGDHAGERLDLIEQTNPNPWALNWNDHVPANFRYAPDGYFYVAVGDKGLYGAEGRDGSRVNLRGGGILRLRPDGTKLEVYCRGVRNILDVALDAEGEIFTFDNTDEHAWMGRLTHMVDGGFYGYPHDFQPQQPYTLWMMADFGAGAATGALCNNDDGLPPQYQGNLFLADFGKRQILRVEIARQGGTFQVTGRTDLFIDPPGDFRPVGIALDAQGTSIYVCDWNHAGTKEDVACGRLLRLWPAQPGQPSAKPAWYAEAAAGRQPAVATTELIEALEHTSENLRLAAQRRLADRGAAAIPALQSTLRDSQRSSQAKIHALWVCDLIDGGTRARADIRELARSDDARSRRQALRQLGAAHATEAVPDLLDSLGSADASVRFQSATALGRIGDPRAIEPIQHALTEQDLFARYALIHALRRLGARDGAHWRQIASGLTSTETAIRTGSAFALRDTFDLSVIEALQAVALDADAPASGRATAVELLGSLALRGKEWKGEWWAYHPALTAPPVKTEQWAGTMPVRDTLLRALSDQAAEVRLAAALGLRPLHDDQTLEHLLNRFPREGDARVRAEVLLALGSVKHPHTTELAREILQDHRSEPGLISAAVGALAAVADSASAELLTEVARSPGTQTSVLTAALKALGSLRSESAVELFESAAGREEAEVRDAAITGLRALQTESAELALLRLARKVPPANRSPLVLALTGSKSAEARSLLLEAFHAPETRDAARDALTADPHSAAADVYLSGLADRDYLVRRKCVDALTAIRGEVREAVEQAATTLPPAAVARLQEIYRDDAQAQRGPLFAIRARSFDAGEYLSFARGTAGDAPRGKLLFNDTRGMGCFKCHRVHGQGGEVGPDLSEIGDQFDRVQLAEHVLYPGKSVREGYQQVTVLLDSGRTVTGLVATESTDHLVLRDSEGRLNTLPKSQIEERHQSPTSLMPEKLAEGISPEEFSDLISYLQSLSRRGTP